MKRISEILEIEEIYGITEEGATKPLRVRLSNGDIAIVKYPNNYCGNQILINEFMGSCIADKLGLDIPMFGICHLSEEILSNTDPEWGLDSSNAGLCFFTKYISSSIPVTFGALMTMEIKQFDLAKLIIFDHVICNRERHAGNMILGIGKENCLYAIDHGTIFAKGYRYDVESLSKEVEDKNILDMSILCSNKEIYGCLKTKFSCTDESIKVCCKETRAILDDSTIKNIQKNIPNEWIKITGSDTIIKLVEAINCRIDRLDEIVDLIIVERRHQ